jgi:translation elongation factor EF-Tu-like GTPase
MEEQEVGTVVDFFAKVNVAGIQMTGRLAVGDTIHIKGHTTDFQQTVESMQIEHQVVQEVNDGDSVGIRVKDRCRAHDVVYKVIE